MSVPDLTLHTPTTRIDVFAPAYPIPAHVYVRESNLGFDLTEAEAELVARTLIQKPEDPEDDEVFLPKGKHSPLAYERLAKVLLKELADVVRTTEMSAVLRAQLRALQIDIRRLAIGDVTE